MIFLHGPQSRWEMTSQAYISDCYPSIIGTPLGESQVLDDHPSQEEDSSEGKHGEGHHANLMTVIRRRQPALCSREIEHRSTVCQHFSSIN